MKKGPGQSVRTETQTSAGGVTLRRSAGGLEVVLISTGDPPRWQLPKGLVDKGETPEIAAVREVREETGIEARLGPLIDRIEYWYQSSESGLRVRYHKFVHFFLMWETGGDVANHDDEVNEARWFAAELAIPALAFRSERGIVEKGLVLAAGE
ncbi:MAG TPA: NUDIX domain-containing protein [Gemmatimonadaceae bacterium]|nr:NUDIX domain-containing protein [Gemmatimonadaceae bacterium]